MEPQPVRTPGEAQLTLATAQVRSLCRVTGCQAWKSPRYPLMTWGINPQEQLGPQQPPRSGTFPCSLSRFAAKETGPSEAALSSQLPDSNPSIHPVPLKAPGGLVQRKGSLTPATTTPRRPRTLKALRPLHRKSRTQPSNLERTWTSLNLWGRTVHLSWQEGVPLLSPAKRWSLI